MSFQKKRVLMKNVYYLSVLVLKIQYTQKFEDKIKNNVEDKIKK